MIDKLPDFNIDRSIFLFDDVYPEVAEKLVADIMRMANDSKEKIYFFINSYGGIVSQMNAILDAMDASGCEIVTIVFGEADSCAAVLASSGTKGQRFIGARATEMIHEVSAGTFGTITEMEDRIEEIKKVNTILVTQLAKNCGKTYDIVWNDIKGKDLKMTANEAVAYGLADDTISDTKAELIETLFETTTNSYGRKHLNIGSGSIDNLNGFSKKLEKVVEIKNHSNPKNNNDTNQNKESKMTKEELEMLNALILKANEAGVAIPSVTDKANLEPLMNQLKTVNETNKALSEKNSALEIEKKKLEDTKNVEIAELTSKLEAEQAINNASKKQAIATAFDSLKTKMMNSMPKEAAEATLKVLEAQNLTVEAINSLADSYTVVKPLVTVGNFDFGGKGDVPVVDTAKSELDAMKPKQ